MRLLLPLLPVAAASLLASCNNVSHLLVYHHSNVGFCAGLNPETNNVHVRLGLRQETAALVPKVRLPALDADGNQKVDDKGLKKTVNTAASSYVAMRVNVASPLGVPEVNELVASGEAADVIGSSPDALDPFTKGKDVGSEGTTTTTAPAPARGTGNGQ